MRSKDDLDRRGFLGQMGDGLAFIAFATLLGKGGKVLAAPPHFTPQAKRVLQIFCPGAVSHVDTFDYKPELQRRSGEPLPGGEKIFTFQGKNGNLMGSPWGFTRRGQRGMWISDLLPHLGGLVDDMAFIHSMTSKTNTHGPGCVLMNTGFVNEGFPSAGAWVSYGLGSENDNLPTFVAIPDIRGLPTAGPANWSSGFLAADNAATAFNAAEPIRDLLRPPEIPEAAELDSRELLALMNHHHSERYPGNPVLSARQSAYELAARMQLSAPEVSDLSSESPATRALYGVDDPNPLIAAYAQNCLLSRRLLERGVRFVTLFCGSRASAVGGLLNWDCHNTLQADYERHLPILDRPTAGLIRDLQGRGLLDDTLVLWTTEFGRMPTHQEGTLGRDHNPRGFTVWMLGAGVRSGVSYGATDEFGSKVVENPVTVHDFHATVLHLLGLDHKKLTYYHNGIERRLTDVHGHVIRDILDS